MKWWDWMPWSSYFECWVLSQLFHSPLWLSSRGSFSSSSLSAIRVVSCAYLRLLIFLLAILIPACESCSPAFSMMYSACKLNKQVDICSPILNQSVFPCPIPTVASWAAYRFPKRQVRWSSTPSSILNLVKNFPQCEPAPHPFLSFLSPSFPSLHHGWPV